MPLAPRILLVVVLVLGGLHLTSAPAGATAVSVADEAEYRAALSSLAADSSGPHTITLTAPITITGGTDPTYTGSQALTIDGNGFTLSGGTTRRVLSGSGPALTLTDIEVRDGFSAGDGGAVFWTGDLTVTDALLTDNVANGPGNVTGGAIDVDNGVVTVERSTFRDNNVTSTTAIASSGAIRQSGTGSIAITGSVFESNTATGATSASGGSVFAVTTVDVDDSVFAHNAATGTAIATGGAIRASGVDIDGSVLWDNEAVGPTGASGGGAYGTASLTVQRSTLHENRASSTGGAAEGSAVFTPDAAELIDTTITGNVADGATERGAVRASSGVTGAFSTIVGNEGVQSANLNWAGTLDVTGFVVGDPIGGPNCFTGGIFSAEHSVDDDGTCGFGTGTGNQSNVADIALGGLRDNGGADTLAAEAAGDAFPTLTMFPLAGSPVVDVLGGSCPDDPRGVARGFGSACDVGAIEQVFAPHPFSDVPPWVEDAVRWLASDVNDPVLITGITPTTFAPNASITRGQVVRMLFREAGAPGGYPPHPFTDVPAWVEDAVRWAHDEGIVTGITPTLFKPNDSITRAQVVRMKYRFAGSPPVGALPAHPFSDVPAWVQDAVRWAANTDNPLPLVTGITPTTFVPNDPITRAQVARMDYRLALTPAAWADPGDAPATMLFRPRPVS